MRPSVSASPGLVGADQRVWSLLLLAFFALLHVLRVCVHVCVWGRMGRGGLF